MPSTSELPRTVAQCNPGAEYFALREDIDGALLEVAGSGWYVLGEQVVAFEREFAEFCHRGFCSGVANGTDAVELALRAAGIGAGDLVVTVSMTAVATVAAIERTGAIPVLVDVEADTATLCPEALAATLEAIAKGEYNLGGTAFSRAAAIIVVHLYGQPAAMSDIQQLAEDYGCTLIEDCCQAHGATHHGTGVGNFGQLSAYSFYPTKNLAALGDGGAVLTNDETIHRRVQELRQYGWKEKFVSSEPGINSRLDEIQAAVLRVKLSALQKFNKNRQHIAALYQREIDNPRVQLPVLRASDEHVFHQYVVRCRERSALAEHLQKLNVATAIHYPAAVHQQPAYRDRILIGANGLAVTEQLTERILSLPMWALLPIEQAQQVADAINAWAGPA